MIKGIFPEYSRGKYCYTGNFTAISGFISKKTYSFPAGNAFSLMILA